MSLISQAKIKFVQSLKYKKYRHKHQCYVVEGQKACQTALKSGLHPKFSVYLGTAPTFFSDTDILYEADEPTLKSLSSLESSTSLISIFELPLERELDENNIKGNVILFLDRIQDPGNLGTIIRTADWYGVKALILNKGCVDIFNPKTIQASMGSHVNLTYYRTEIAQVKSALSSHHFIGLDMHGESLMSNDHKNKSVVLIVGNEGQGLSSDVKMHLDQCVSIPGHQDRRAESLNAAIATAVSLDRLIKL